VTDPPPAAPPPPGSSATTFVVIVVAVLGVGVVVVGILAAIAIPAFVRYTRRAKTAEAVEILGQVARGVAAYYEQERVSTIAPGTVTRSLPPSLARTPPGPSCQPTPWPADADPAWQAIGVAPGDPLRFSYELVVAPDGRSFVARAAGDLDCDGQTSLFERSGVVGPDGELVLSRDLRIENETE